MSETTTRSPTATRTVRRHRLVKVGVSVALLAVALAVLSIHQRGSVRLVWGSGPEIVAIAGLATGCAILLAWTRRPVTRVVAATGAVLGYVTLAGLPWIVGQMIHGRSDTLVHFSFVGHITTEGHLPVDLIYPHYHTLSSIFAQVLNVSVPVSMHLTVVVLGVFAICGLTVLYRVVPATVPRPAVALSVAVIAMLSFPFNIYNVSYYPIGLSLFFLPLVLYVVVRRIDRYEPGVGESWRLAVVLLVAAAALSVSHPVTFAMLVLLLAVVAGVEKLRGGPARVAILIGVVVLGVQWYWHVGVIQHSIGNAIRVFASDQTSTANTVSTIADLPLLEFLLMKYGKHILLAVVTFVLGYLAVFRSRRPWPTTVQALLVWGVLAGVGGIAMFLTTSLVGPMRVVDGSAAIWVSLVGVLVCTRRFGPRVGSIGTVVVLFSVCLLVAASVAFAIPSPVTYQYGWETTDAEADTTDWLAEYGGDRPIDAVGFHERAPLLTIAWTEWPSGDFNRRFGAATDRDDVVGREQPGVYDVDPTDERTIANNLDDQLVVITGWNVWHAENRRLVESRDIPQIAEQFDRHGVAAFERSVNRIYTDGRNRIYSRRSLEDVTGR